MGYTAVKKLTHTPLQTHIIHFYYLTNLLYVLLGVNIGVPFRVTHDVKARNHGNILLVDLFVHIGYVNELGHYYVAMSVIGDELLLLHELNLHYEDLA